MKGQTNQRILDHQLQRRLRKNPTDAKRALWRHLRGSQVEGFKFRRQHPYLDDILDFVCLERKLTVEVDGGQHAESRGDRERDRWLEEAGFHILRFWNNEVLGEMTAVLEVIRGALVAQPHPHPSLPPEGEGAKPALPPLQGGEAGVSQSTALRRPNGLAAQSQPRTGRGGDGVPHDSGAPAC